MRLRFVSWNVDGLHPNRGQEQVLSDASWDVCALQVGPARSGQAIVIAELDL